MAKHDNPYDACKALVSQAYKLWLQKETRTDDISAVVLFFDWKKMEGSSRGAAVAGAAGGAAAAAAAPAAQQDTPPQGGEATSRLGSVWRSRSGKKQEGGV